MKKGYILLLALTLLLFSFVQGCLIKEKRTELKVVIAGSLLVPFQEIEEKFEAKNPDIDILLEGHGSVQVIRSVTELDDAADLVVVADSQLIPAMMYDLPVEEGGVPYADWLIEFSTNRLGLAYHENSAYASTIDSDNWYEIISRPDVTLGIADPRIDAMGYRILMVLKLAENLYEDKTIFENTVGLAFEPSITVGAENGVHVITVPELLKPVQSRIKLRGYSILLMALLESGDLDYAFEYESVAKQRGLQFLPLPPQIDLSDSEYEETYRKVEVRLDFKRFATLFPDFSGTRIVYGMSIPNNAHHPEEAARFVRFLLGEDGESIFGDSRQPLLETPLCDNMDNLPESLKPLFP